MPNSDRPYHHGDLRNALLQEALEVIEAESVAQLSLRNLARKLGVSHGAPAHHFADKEALLTAIAAEGYERLSERLEAATEAGFLEVGLAYVRFSVDNPAYVAVMYQPRLYNTGDESVRRARERATSILYETAQRFRPDAEGQRVGLAGWCLMHGFAALWLAGNLEGIDDDPVAVARWLAEATFPA